MPREGPVVGSSITTAKGIGSSRHNVCFHSDTSKELRLVSGPRSLIINSPYERPGRHWLPGRGTKLELAEGRRPAAYEVIDTRSNTKRVESLEQV